MASKGAIPDHVRVGRLNHKKIELGQNHVEHMKKVSDYSWESRAHWKALAGKTISQEMERLAVDEHTQKKYSNAEGARMSMLAAIQHVGETNDGLELSGNVKSVIDIALVPYLSDSDLDVAIASPETAHKVFTKIVKELWSKGQLKRK